MAIRHGIVASSVLGLPPSVTIGNATNFNQNLATLNATVNAQGVSTSVKFQYSTSSVFSSYTEVNGVPSSTTDNNIAVYANITGLSEGTVYYFRCVVSNFIDTVTSNTNNFTTWALQVYERSTSGGTTFTIPTVTPTGGSAVSVSIYDIIMFGGGGGGNFAGSGGGGGGYQNVASRSMTGSRSITTSVGAGGAAGTPGVNGSNGGNTSLTGDLTSLTANGGGRGTSGTSPQTGEGVSGNGNNPGAYQEYVPSKGLSNIGYGGGGGAGAAGGNGTANSTTATGGTGGTGVSITSGGVTRAGGAGGGGAAYIGLGAGTQGSQGTNNTYGSGGNSSQSAPTAGQNGYIRFRYYAASALA